MALRVSSQSVATKEDDLTNLVGQFGKWQFIIFATISLVKLSSGWVQMSAIFLTPNTTFLCVSFANSTRVAEKNTCYEDCVSYVYDNSPMGNTIVSEWDLVCDRHWLASFTHTVLQFGILLGSILFGFLSDRYGRKNTFLVSVVSLIALGFAVPFSPNYAVFTILRFFIGVATAGTVVVSFVILMESVGTKYRELLGCLYQIPFIVGYMTVPLFAYYFRSWSEYTLALAVPPLIYLGYVFVLSESPRWLVSVGRVDEATAIVKRAAEINGRPTIEIEDTLKKMSEDIRSQSNQVKPNYADLFKKSLWLKTVSCCYMWMICGLTYYGFNQYISQTSSNLFITVAAASAIQLPSNFIAIWLIQRFGRKLIIATFFTLGGICVIVLGIVPNEFRITLTLGSLGVSCVSIVATCMYIYTSELFPTVVRNMGLGACSTSMRVGSMIAPFISNLTVTVSWLPTVMFGLASISSGLVCLLLPETRGSTLPDNLENIISTEKQ